jgi:hypothetical protein
VDRFSSFSVDGDGRVRVRQNVRLDGARRGEGMLNVGVFSPAPAAARRLLPRGAEIGRTSKQTP